MYGANSPQALVERGITLTEKWKNHPIYVGRNKYGKPITENVDLLYGLDDTASAFTAILCENMQTFFAGKIHEATYANAIQDYEKHAFQLIRAVYPNLVAQQLVSVQPMLGPTSTIFYLRYVYGSTKGTITAGDTINDPLTGRGYNGSDYTSEKIDEEQFDTGDGTTNKTGAGYAGTLSWTSIRPGTVTITDGTQKARDDGNGSFDGDVAAGTINYGTGAIAAVTWNDAVTNGNAITATYEYVSEGNSSLPEINLQLTQSSVTARTRKLKMTWSTEAAHNYKVQYGLDAEVDLVATAGEELRYETDREIINDLRTISNGGTTTWSKTAPAGVSWTEHKASIVDAFSAASNKIFGQTQRAKANWIVAGLDVATILETLQPLFQPVEQTNNVTGVHLIGKLAGRWDVYMDPFYPASEALIGYKGNNPLEVGYIFAPYLLAYATPTIVLEDFVTRKGMASQYGKKAVNPQMYGKVIVTA